MLLRHIGQGKGKRLMSRLKAHQGNRRGSVKAVERRSFNPEGAIDDGARWGSSAGNPSNRTASPSLRPYTASSPVTGLAICWSLYAAISKAVLATFHTRTSSMMPWKNPAATPVEVRAEPIPKCCMLSFRGTAPVGLVKVPSRTPSRYSFQVKVVVS